VTPPPPLPSPPPPSPGPNKAIVIAGAGATGAALITGVVFMVLANGKASTARDETAALVMAKGPGVCAQHANCPEVMGTLEDWTTFKNAAVSSFVIGGALGAATIGYVLATKSGQKPAVRVAPIMTTSGGGVMVGGAW